MYIYFTGEGLERVNGTVSSHGDPGGRDNLSELSPFWEHASRGQRPVRVPVGLPRETSTLGGLSDGDGTLARSFFGYFCFVALIVFVVIG